MTPVLGPYFRGYLIATKLPQLTMDIADVSMRAGYDDAREDRLGRVRVPVHEPETRMCNALRRQGGG